MAGWVQLALPFEPGTDRWIVEVAVKRLIGAGDHCPVAGGDAVAQWLQSCVWKLEHYTEIRESMVAKKTTTAAKITEVAWVNYKLSDEDVEAFQTWSAPEDEVSWALVELVNDGYKLTFAFDHFNKALMVSIVCHDPKSPNFGKGFSTFARDWNKLIALAVYKHLVIFGRIWPEVERRASGAEFG